MSPNSNNTYNMKYRVFQHISNNESGGKYRLTFAENSESGSYLISAKSLSTYIGHPKKRIQDWATLKRCGQKLHLTNAYCEAPMISNQFLKGQGRDFLPVQGDCLKIVTSELILKNVATPDQVNNLIQIINELPKLKSPLSIEEEKITAAGQLGVPSTTAPEYENIAMLNRIEELVQKVQVYSKKEEQYQKEIARLQEQVEGTKQEWSQKYAALEKTREKDLLQEQMKHKREIGLLNAQISDLNYYKGKSETQDTQLQTHTTNAQQHLAKIKKLEEEIELLAVFEADASDKTKIIEEQKAAILLFEKEKAELVRNRVQSKAILQEWKDKYNEATARLQQWESEAANPTIAAMKKGKKQKSVSADFINAELPVPVANAKKVLRYMNMGLSAIMQFITVPVNTLGLYCVLIFIVTFSRPSFEWTMFLNPVFWLIAAFWAGIDIRRAWLSYELGRMEAKLSGHKEHNDSILTDYEANQLRKDIKGLTPKAKAAQKFNYISAIASAVICVLIGIGTFEGGDIKKYEDVYQSQLETAYNAMSADSSRIINEYDTIKSDASNRMKMDSLNAWTAYQSDTSQASTLKKEDIATQQNIVQNYTGPKDYNYQIVLRRTSSRLSAIPKEFKRAIGMAESKRDSLIRVASTNFQRTNITSAAKKDSLLEGAFAVYQNKVDAATSEFTTLKQKTNAEITIAGTGLGMSRDTGKTGFYILISLIAFLALIHFIEDKINEGWKATGRYKGEGFVDFLVRHNLNTTRVRQLIE